MSPIRGALTALVTPFSGGEVDEAALRRLVDKQIDEGIHGLVPCGTTGESPTLSHAEHLRVVEIVVNAAAGRVPVVAGAGSNSTREAIELARGAAKVGAAASLQITPYYNKPGQDGLIRHFSEIADAIDLPMIVYNVPGERASTCSPIRWPHWSTDALSWSASKKRRATWLGQAASWNCADPTSPCSVVTTSRFCPCSPSAAVGSLA